MNAQNLTVDLQAFHVARTHSKPAELPNLSVFPSQRAHQFHVSIRPIRAHLECPAGVHRVSVSDTLTPARNALVGLKSADQAEKELAPKGC